MSNSQKGWPFVQRLLVDLFKFMEPYLRNAELGEPVCLSSSFIFTALFQKRRRKKNLIDRKGTSFLFLVHTGTLVTSVYVCLVQIHFLYKGTLRVLLVLLHDFPEFLCDYHFSFCDVIPISCIQMRNVILSAFPRNMRLPDPSTPNLKVVAYYFVSTILSNLIFKPNHIIYHLFFVSRLIY